MSALAEAGRHMHRVDQVVKPARALVHDDTLPRDVRALLFTLIAIEIALMGHAVGSTLAPPNPEPTAPAGGIH